MKAVSSNHFISIIIPCLNEGYTIQRCIQQAQQCMGKINLPYEVVVVDNGSTDDTARLAQDAGAVLVGCTAKGYGAAVQAGVDASSGSIIIVGDGDGSYDFSKLSEFILPLLNSDGIVLGNRFNANSPMPGAMPWSHRIIGNPLLTAILNLVCWSNIKDAHCGLRSFTRKTYQKVSASSRGFEYCSEMLIKAIKNGIDIKQVPIILHNAHPGRQSKLRTIPDGIRHLLVILFFAFGSRAGAKFLYFFKLA